MCKREKIPSAVKAYGYTMLTPRPFIHSINTLVRRAGGDNQHIPNSFLLQKHGPKSALFLEKEGGGGGKLLMLHVCTNEWRAEIPFWKKKEE